MFFRGHHYSKELEAFISVLGQLRASLHFANKLMPYCDPGDLFANEDNLDNEVAESLNRPTFLLRRTFWPAASS
jgi:hormone-sensitive lipase